MQGSESMHEMIYLSDDESFSVGFCQCNVAGPLRRVVLALPAILLCFRPVPPAAPPSPPVYSSRSARATYMRAWHTRARKARIRAHAIVHASLRRSPRLARTLE